MKVILKSDVKKLGKKGDIVEVADGYARNFLFRQNLAVEVSKKSMEILDEEKLQMSLKEKQLETDAEQIKKQMESIVLEFKVKSGKDGRVFGSVSGKQIMDQLYQQHNIKIDKRKILHSQAINTMGYTDVQVDLYKNRVIGVIRVHLSE